MTESLKISLLSSQHWVVYRLAVLPLSDSMFKRYFYIRYWYADEITPTCLMLPLLPDMYEGLPCLHS